MSTDGPAAFSCIFLNTYYSRFVNNYYRRNPEHAQLSYQEQKALLQGTWFGDCDFYSSGLKKSGWQADDFIVNCAPLQNAWARENGISAEGLSIAIEQIRSVKPQVLYLQDLNLANKEFLNAARPHVGIIVGQIASPLPAQTYFAGIDIMVSSFPHFVERFRAAGITTYYQPLAFDPRILESLPSTPYLARPIECSFIGGISPSHHNGYQLLEQLAAKLPMEFMGYGAESLPLDSFIRKSHRGEVWGREMFRAFQASRITVNRHIDVAENYANNMRLFEATGCGALLITDYKDNLNDLFEIGKEVVAYRSAEECIDLIHYYRQHTDEAGKIAASGQARTLRDHTYILRMGQTGEILERHLRYRGEKDRFLPPNIAKISYGHTPISRETITPDLTSAWKNTSIPNQQRSLVQQELSSMYMGKTPIAFQVLANTLKPIVAAGDSVLEIGCSSGYYYEVLGYLLSRPLDYTGVDYSEAMIAMAEDFYPKTKFLVADGARLSFSDRQFHTVISSCVLLHVPNYREHIAETARVADKFVVAARTPICKSQPTQYLKKLAYGVETVELRFNEEDLLREFSLQGLELIQATEYFADPAADSYQATYLFKRS